jgi:two-component system NtrC family sensor kinase
MPTVPTADTDAPDAASGLDTLAVTHADTQSARSESPAPTMLSPQNDDTDTLLPLLRVVVDNSQNPIFLVEPDLHIRYANRAAHAITVQLTVSTGRQPSSHRVSELHPDLLPSFALEMAASAGEWNGEVALPIGQRRPLVLMLQIIAIRSTDGALECYGVSARDISFEYARKSELQSRNAELEVAYRRLKGAQDQLLQSEKLASIGQLAAGVAHEINNPIGYVHSNLATLQEYSKHLLTLIEAYDRLVDASGSSQARAEVNDLRQRLDFSFLQGDLPQLIEESREGIERVRKIVQDLKDFSRSDARDKFVLADLHRGLDSTLNIIWNDLKYKAQVVKTFGEIPQIECIPSELNQVFMNILLNAG